MKLTKLLKTNLISVLLASMALSGCAQQTGVNSGDQTPVLTADNTASAKEPVTFDWYIN